MKLFTVNQIKQCENLTLISQKLNSIDLMERAATVCLHWIQENYDTTQPFVVLCGMGNNGGDGLALTRLLLQEGYTASAIVLKHSQQFSANTSENLKQLHLLDPDALQIIEEGEFVSNLPANIILIDALFGIGLNRPLQGWLAEFIKEINYLPNIKISIDIPSGLPADTLPNSQQIPTDDLAIIKATQTLSFEFYKRSFLHPESEEFVGNLQILSIGLDIEYIKHTYSQFQIIDKTYIQSFFRRRLPFSHKGNYGTVLLVGGSYGSCGAIALAALGALRTGAGKVIIQAPECCYPGIQSFVPEAMYLKGGKQFIESIPKPNSEFTCGLGPGMGMQSNTTDALKSFLENQTQPILLDADALNILAQFPDLIQQIPSNSIITPHPKEFERLFGKSENSILMVEKARHNAMKHNIIIVLKGHRTLVALPDGSCYYNISGNAGMATAGSGDILSGIITALLAQKYSPAQSAILGVYLHAVAGDFAANIAQESLIARDIAHHLPLAFQSIQTSH